MELTALWVKQISLILQIGNLSYEIKNVLKTGANHSSSTFVTLIFSLSGLCFKNEINFEIPLWDKKWTVWLKIIQIYDRKSPNKKKPLVKKCVFKGKIQYLLKTFRAFAAGG